MFAPGVSASAAGKQIANSAKMHAFLVKNSAPIIIPVVSVMNSEILTLKNGDSTVRTTIVRGVVVLACAASCAAAFGQDLDHSQWTAILRQYVTPQSRVDYARLKADGTNRLDSYLEQIANPWPGTLDENARKAALINAYNALTVRWAVSNFPVKSIWRTKDPFRVTRHQVNGATESLDSIETRLRNMRDPRIHGALVCAARSCPPLRREAYLGAAVDGQLDDNFRVWLADTSKNQFVPGKRLAKVSKIFEWYAADFAAVRGVPAALKKFAPPDAFASTNKLEYLKYNWGLNDSGSVGDSYSGFEFYIDYARNGYLRSDFEGWFLGLGRRYGVNPLIFGAIYVGAIPFFSLSIAWLVRNLRRRRPLIAPLMSSSFFFVSAYLYLLIAGKNIPGWVYVFVVAMLILGAWSMVRKVRARVATGERSA